MNRKKEPTYSQIFLSNSSPDSRILTSETLYSLQPQNLTRLFSPTLADKILLLSHVYQLPKGVKEKVSMDGSRLRFPPSIQSAAILRRHWSISSPNPGTQLF